MESQSHENTKIEAIQKKRMKRIQLLHDQEEAKLRQEEICLRNQKRRRQVIFDLAREASLVMKAYPKESFAEKSMAEDKEVIPERKERTRFTAKMALLDYMTQIPSDLPKNWIIYAIPNGKKCLVVAHEKKTILRDKGGKLLEQTFSLLPNGNAFSADNGRTMLQGIYCPAQKIVYLVDILIWNDTLLIEYSAEARLSFLFAKIQNNPALCHTLSPNNHIMMRLPKMLECRSGHLETIYSGLYKRLHEPGFSTCYEKLYMFAQHNGLLNSLGLEHADPKSPEIIQRICSAFGEDNIGEGYLKDGIAFLRKAGLYSLGGSECFVKWKDSLCSLHFEKLLHSPMIAYLLLGRDRNLVTHDGYIVAKTDPAIEMLKLNKVYLFTYTNLSLSDPFATLENLHYIQESSKIIWNSVSQLAFKILVRKNMIPFSALLNQILLQEKENFL